MTIYSSDVKINDIYNCRKVIKLYRYKDRACCDTQCIHCGKVLHNVHASSLDNLKYNSCMCRSMKYPERNKKLYSIFHNIKYRCENPNCHEYHNYGAKGIKMCKEWREDYMAFERWALLNGYSDGLTIDRIDVDGDYCPENCEWVTLSENVRRSNISRDRKKYIYYYIDENGNKIYFDNASKLAKELNLKAHKIIHASHSNLIYENIQFGIEER